jgi:molybdenum cofactor guanylyltransferase
MTVQWSGAVLCGGRSRRMGRDKALLSVDGEPMARRVAKALFNAGTTDVVTIGGNAAALSALGLSVVPDEVPPPELWTEAAGYRPSLSKVRGEGWSGPLVGIVTALDVLTTDVVLVVACDLVEPSAKAMSTTVAALAAAPEADLAVPHVDGVPQWLHGAWRRSARPRLAEQLVAGERAVHRAVAAAALGVVDVPGLATAALADADVPTDLPPQVEGCQE